MFRELYDWFRGEINPEYRGVFTPDTKLDTTNPPTRCGEKKTPETNPSEPLPQKETELERSKRIFYERLQLENKETKERLKSLRLVSETFVVGEHVEYLKIPNNLVKFYVSDFRDFMLHTNYNGRLIITKSIVTVQYFDSNNILQTITDESKWFRKV